MVGSVASSGGFDLTKMMQEQKKLFTAMDTNNDGSVSKDEMSSFIQNLQSNDSTDSTSSSTSSSSDVSSLVDSIFKNADSDSNGLLSLQESEANLAKVAQQMQSQSSSYMMGGSGGMGMGGMQGPGGEKMSQMKENFDALGSALDSGDLDDAQAAFEKLQENAPSNGNQPQEVTDLSNALSSGDLDAAKEAYSQIKEKMSQGPHGAPPEGGSGQTQSTSKENELFKTLIGMRSSDQSSDSSSSSGDSGSQSSTSSASASGLKDILASAVQNYLQWSNAYAQSSNSTLLSSSLYG